MSEIKDNNKVRGFYRITLTDGKTGKKKGDSGWRENQITNLGARDYLLNWLVGETGDGKSVSHAALGTGGSLASDDTSLEGEVEKRAEVSTSIISSRTAEFTAQFASDNSFVTDTRDISNIGLFNDSSGGTVFAGNTYASSSCATNQNCNMTYQIQFPS